MGHRYPIVNPDDVQPVADMRDHTYMLDRRCVMMIYCQMLDWGHWGALGSDVLGVQDSTGDSRGPSGFRLWLQLMCCMSRMGFPIRLKCRKVEIGQEKML